MFSESLDNDFIPSGHFLLTEAFDWILCGIPDSLRDKVHPSILCNKNNYSWVSQTSVASVEATAE